MRDFIFIFFFILSNLLIFAVAVEVHTGFWWGNLKERDHLENKDIDGRIILRWILRKWDVGVWTGLSWLRIGTSGGHL
jgi:hypothetical protein